MEDSEVQLWDSRSAMAGMRKCGSRLRILIKSQVDSAEMSFSYEDSHQNRRRHRTIPDRDHHDHHRDNKLFMSQETCPTFLGIRKPLLNIKRLHKTSSRKGRHRYETLDVQQINRGRTGWTGRTDPVRDGRTDPVDGRTLRACKNNTMVS